MIKRIGKRRLVYTLKNYGRIDISTTGSQTIELQMVLQRSSDNLTVMSLESCNLEIVLHKVFIPVYIAQLFNEFLEMTSQSQ